jgi:hypothetical protein
MGTVTAARGWLFSPMPRGRIAVLRTILYGFIFVDVLLTTAWVVRHGDVPPELYHPLFFGRVLPLPIPTPLVVRSIEIALLVSAGIAAIGRAPRLAGTATFVLYFEWMMIAFSYGKVDHDRVAFLVALAVLPTVGSARWRDEAVDEASGWAIRCIQIAVVLTYFLSVFAKLRFGGIEWVNSSTLMRSVIRRGTLLAEPLEDYPWVLQAAQYWIVAFELASPLLLIEGRVRRVMLVLAVAFHLTTFSTIGIIFLPHVMCLLSFIPLEELRSGAKRIQLPARARAPGRPPRSGGSERSRDAVDGIRAR